VKLVCDTRELGRVGEGSLAPNMGSSYGPTVADRSEVYEQLVPQGVK